MNSKTKKELYWIEGILLATFITGALVFGDALWDGRPIDIQLHDTYFVFTKTLFLVVVFIVLFVIVYGCRAVFSSSSIILKIVMGILVVIVIGTLIIVRSAMYRLRQQAAFIASAPVEERWEGKFSRAKYPSDKYNIAYDTIEVDSFRVVLIVAVESDTTFTQIGEVWVQRLVGDSVTQKCVGSIDSEVGVWVPDQQPIPGMFMTVEYSEYGGKINLVGEQGDFIEIPGTLYALDVKDRIYTAYVNDHDTLVHEYDLKSHRGTYLDNKQFPRNDLTFQQTGPGRWLYRQK
jgi:hypothetical protein